MMTPRLGLLVIALLGGLLSARPAAGQVATAPELKAAFLLNFVKFTTWPAAALGGEGPIRMCVLGDARVASALDGLTAGQKVAGHPLLVLRMKSEEAAAACHLLYASGLDEEAERRLLELTRRAAVLTTSDSRTFMRRGGIAAFHIADGRMKFSINPAAAERAQLRISSRLLSLAVIVKDAVDAQLR
jgi:hypothetical protein